MVVPRNPRILKESYFARCWGEFFFFLKKTLRVSPAYSKEHGRDRDKSLSESLVNGYRNLSRGENLAKRLLQCTFLIIMIADSKNLAKS